MKHPLDQRTDRFARRHSPDGWFDRRTWQWAMLQGNIAFADLWLALLGHRIGRAWRKWLG